MPQGPFENEVEAVKELAEHLAPAPSSDREDKCPVCGGEGGDPEGGGCPTCDGTGQSPSDREERIEKAVDAAEKEIHAMRPAWVSSGKKDRDRDIVEVAAPVIVRAERERIKARIEAVRAAAPSWPDDDSYEAGLDAALSAIEGENNE